MTGPAAADPPFRQTGAETIYEGYAIRVAVGTFAGDDGTTFTRDIVHHPGAVAVVPLHEDGSVTCVRQYRPAIGRTLLEIPAGLRDVADEPMAETATRELAEEVGLRAESITHLVSFHNAVGHSDEEVHVFVAKGLTPIPAQPLGPEEEAMTIERHGLAELRSMIRAGQVTDVKTIVAVGLLSS